MQQFLLSETQNKNQSIYQGPQTYLSLVIKQVISNKIWYLKMIISQIGYLIKTEVV